MTETRTIHYRPIPRLMAASVTVALPAYTGRQPSKRDGGDVRALEGSRLSWEFIEIPSRRGALGNSRRIRSPVSACDCRRNRGEDLMEGCRREIRRHPGQRTETVL